MTRFVAWALRGLVPWPGVSQGLLHCLAALVVRHRQVQDDDDFLARYP
jgi:hypothetical protein